MVRRPLALWLALVAALVLVAVREDRARRVEDHRAAAVPATRTAPSAPTPSGVPTLADPRGDAPLDVVTLGDSVPAGGACDCAAFPELVTSRLRADLHRPVVDTNLAAGGLTSADVLTQVGTPEVGAALRRADLVVIEIGANDFDEDTATDPVCSTSGPCDPDGVAELRTGLTRIVERVRSAGGPSDRAVLLLGYWNVFRDGATGRAQGPAYVAGSDRLTRDVNAAIDGVARATGSLYVDVYGPFAAVADPTDHLAGDGDHPNAAGHRLIADAVVTAVEGLRTPATPGA